MKIGEIWVLRNGVKIPSTDQININYDDDVKHYNVVPALVIIRIEKNTLTDACTNGFDGDYLIFYEMIFGMDYNKPYSHKTNFSHGSMGSGCLLRNYVKLYDEVEIENR